MAFTITPDYFKGMTDAYGMFDEPEDGETLTIDRVDPCKGYEPGNLRVVTLSVNVIKGNRERYLPEHVQDMLRREREKVREEVQEHLDRDPDHVPF